MASAQQFKPVLEFNLRQLWRFLYLLFSQFYRDHGFQISAALAYTTLLAIVPMLTVSFNLISSLTVYPNLLQMTQDFIINTFTPGVGEELRRYLLRFVANSNKLGNYGLIIFILVVFMTLNTVDKTLNRIWKVTNRRHTLFSLLVYSLVMLIGPFLIGISLAVSAYLESIPTISNAITQVPWLSWLPLVITFFAFTAIYRWVPNLYVAWRYAVPGGLVAALLFEWAKHGFTLYITWFPNYELVYGALAVIPLTLLWIYLSWVIILIGAETTHCLAIYQLAVPAKSKLLSAVYHLLLDIYLADGKGLSLERGAQASKKERRQIFYILEQLHTRGLIEIEAGWCRATDKLAELGLFEVYGLLQEYTHTGRFPDKNGEGGE